MNIVIMRHGEAESCVSSDEQRHLTEQGREQALMAGQSLVASGFFPDQLWVSPYIRALQTIDGAVRSLYAAARQVQNQHSLAVQATSPQPTGPQPPSYRPQVMTMLVPESDPAAVLDKIAQTRCNNLLIVSHQPLVSTLIGLLANADRRSGPPMAPASIAMLSAGMPLAGCCDLLWLRHTPDFEISL